jgi:hypothetical protein
MAALAHLASAQMSSVQFSGVSIQDGTQVGWHDANALSDKGDKNAVDSASEVKEITTSYDLTVQTAAGNDQEQNDIDADLVPQRKKDQGIYDPNMYPFGPLHGDYRAPGSDDAVSDPISLPEPFPFFNGQTTNTVRASTNGMIILEDRQVFENNPSELPSIEIDTPFVAGFWNDIWSKKHGKVYWRLEQTNTTLLGEMKQDIIDGFPEFTEMNDLKYAFIFSFWRVTHYGARKANGIKKNTFQITIATDGTYSFLINNYQDIQWNIALGTTNKAVGGFDIDNTYFTMMEGSLEDGSMDWADTSTNSPIEGRHIFRLDDKQPPQAAPTNPPFTGDTDKTPGVIYTDNIWPANDNTLGGAIFSYIPEEQIGNGTCTINFPSTVAWFHVFDAHIRADSPVTSMVWKICAANPTFEPNQNDGSFTFAVQFNRGFEFDSSEITMTCSSQDEYTYAVYSFPQNHLQQSGRSNLRVKGNQWDPNESYVITFANQVGNFTVDDPRVQVSTSDNMAFVLTDIPPSIEEVWFEFEYLNYFGSNEVGVVGSA